jgi:hypothetical protein
MVAVVSLEVPRIEVAVEQTEGAEFRLLADGVPEWHQAKRQVLLAASPALDGWATGDELRHLDLQARLVKLERVLRRDLPIRAVGRAERPRAGAVDGGSRERPGDVWSIDDAAGRVFATAFYRSLLDAGPAMAQRRRCPPCAKPECRSATGPASC